MSKKRYLITDIFNNVHKIKKNYYFIDEYLSRFYENNKQKRNKNYLFSIKSYSEINHSSKFVFRRVNKYRIQLSKKFNAIHNKTYSNKYWGLILDQFLYLIINKIYIETKVFNKIFIKKKDIIVNSEVFKKSYLDTSDFISSRIHDNSQAYSRYIIAKKLGFKTKRFLNPNFKNLKFDPKKNLLIKVLNKITHLYINIFKPITLVDCYFGKSNSLKIFIKSYGKILPVSHSILFDQKPSEVKKDNEKRKKLFVKENDYFDEVFNKLLKKFLPLSYLENYHYYDKFSEQFKNIKKIGTAVHIIYNDEFKFLSAKILEQKGKLFALPHGGLLGQNKDDYDQIIENKYATKIFRWTDKYPLEHNQLSKLIPYKIDDIKENKHILFYPTSLLMKSNYKVPLLRKYHPYHNFFYELYDNLSLNLKKNVKLKPFPHLTSKHLEKNWRQIYKKNIFLGTNKPMFNNSKIVIIDDYSTPICELLYTGTPFVIIDPEKKNLKPKILNKFLKLKKLNMLFDNASQASNFLNNNYDKIDIWWPKVLKSKIYLDLKRSLIPRSKQLLNLNEALI